MAEITIEEYRKASEIVQRFQYQQDKTLWANVIYKAEVNVSVKVPNEWTTEEIIEELKGGYYDFDQDDEEDINLGKIKRLIVDGVEVPLK
tara:strand:- start:4368 stop:4637 length:270 start_codon:yes stop_codon:yes gene_type:complete